jgi:hypothetical protein
MKHPTKTALLALAISLVPAFAEAQYSSRNSRSAVPRGHEPPAGMCRVWLDNVPPGRQPAPTDCTTAERQAARHGGTVLYGANTTRYRDPYSYDTRPRTSASNDPWGYGYNCSERDWNAGNCANDWEARCPDADGDGYCDGTSRDRYGRLPELAWGHEFAEGRVRHDLRLWLPSPYMEVRFSDGDGRGRPDEVIWVDRDGTAMQSWVDHNYDGRADEVILFRYGRPWRTIR